MHPIRSAIFVILLLAARAEARPPSADKRASATARPHGYYGDYNGCKLQIVPWPSDVSCDASEATPSVLSSNFSVVLLDTSKSRSSRVLSEGMARYSSLIANYHPVHITRGLLVEPQFILEGDDDDYGLSGGPVKGVTRAALPVLHALQVDVLCEHTNDAAKQLDDDESYKINVQMGDDGSVVAVVTANTVWGALYGMETMSQLVESGGIVRNVPVTITDSPRFPWRGLLLDTSNHFISVSVISKFLDTMASSKMNVLHWHLVDSYSFPFESQAAPEIARSGAWIYSEKTKVRDKQVKNPLYTSSDLQRIEELAKMRGIRVVVEMDMPGHAFSWGLAEQFRDITTACPKYTDELGHIDDVPLDPTLTETYQVILNLLTELVAIFPDNYFHVGGDEVKYGCWNESQSILDWMEQNHFAPGDFYSLEQMFFGKIHKMATSELERKLVAWEEVFFNASGGTDGSHGSWIGSDALPPESTMIESWTGPSYLNTARLNGYDGILAYGWYLDRQNPVDGEHSWFFGDTWAQMYGVDPEAPSSSNEELRLLLKYQSEEIEVNSAMGRRVGRALGGEASIWTEQADDQNIESQVWPRAGAVAERLWSPRTITDAAAAAPRLSAWRCLMVSRYSIRAGPVWSDYCSAVMVDT